MNLFLTTTDSKNSHSKKPPYFIFRMTDNPPERYELEQLLSRDQLEIPGKNDIQKSQDRIIFSEPPSSIGVGKDGEPRLIITKIVNTDFKSYAGTKIIGPFHKVQLFHFTSTNDFSRHSHQLLAQMVRENLMSLIQCSLYLVIVQIRFVIKKFLGLFTIHSCSQMSNQPPLPYTSP